MVRNTLCFTRTRYKVWLRSDSYEGNVTWRANYVFVCISAATRENFLGRYTYHFPRKRYKDCTFSRDRWITKGTLLGA